MSETDRRQFMLAVGGLGLLGTADVLAPYTDSPRDAAGGVLATSVVHTRRNVYCLNAYSADIVAYKKAITAMKALPATNKTSWLAQANIHGAFSIRAVRCPHRRWTRAMHWRKSPTAPPPAAATTATAARRAARAHPTRLGTGGCHLACVGPAPNSPQGRMPRSRTISLLPVYARLRAQQRRSDANVRVTFVPRAYVEGERPAQVLRGAAQGRLGRVSVRIE